MNPKNPFDDIIPPGSDTGSASSRRSIRDIPINREKKPNKIDELLEETVEMRAEHHIPPPVYVPPVSVKKENRPGKALWAIAAVILLIALSAVAMTLFRSATVNIAIKTQSIPVEILVSSTNIASTTAGTLPYKILPIQKEGTKEVAATGPSTQIEKKASGTIIIYNKGTASQQLVATTRFETPEKLVYRIDKAVTVPANGSIEALVYADQAGAHYNIDLKDFTIPGFAGTPKFQTMYARSKTTMTGGFVGTMPQVSDADMKAANNELEETLTEQALAEILAQRPADYAFFKEGSRVTYTSSVAPSGEDKALVTGKVSVEGLIFERSAVEKAIADSKNGQQYRYDNLESLTLSIENPTPVDSFLDNPVLSLRLSGTLTTGQSFDEEALRRALSGKSKTQLQEILRTYPEIVEAEATVRPMWSSTFPENAEKIIINIEK
jgi:hypothetical protein